MGIYGRRRVSAGIYQMFTFVETQYGEDIADTIVKDSEYVRKRDPKYDHFKRVGGARHRDEAEDIGDARWARFRTFGSD